LSSRRHPRQQVEALKDEADGPVAQRRQCVAVELGDIATDQEIVAAGRRIEAAEQVHEGRLARTRRAHDGHELAGRDRQIDPAQWRQRGPRQ
jgi:hypothetical protein